MCMHICVNKIIIKNNIHHVRLTDRSRLKLHAPKHFTQYLFPSFRKTSIKQANFPNLLFCMFALLYCRAPFVHCQGREVLHSDNRFMGCVSLYCRQDPFSCGLQVRCTDYCWPHWPLTRYVILRFAHAPGMPGTFSPPPTPKETAS